MLTCAVKCETAPSQSCHLTSHTSKYGPETKGRNGVGGRGTLTSCIWALKSAHEDNWKDCIITWATACGGEHTAHSPWSGTDSTQQAEGSHTHTSTPALTRFFLSYVRDGFSTLGMSVSSRRAAQFWTNVRRKSINSRLVMLESCS